MLNEFGKLIGDFTIANAGDDALHDLGLVGGAEIPHALVREAPAEGRLASRIHRFDQTLVGLSIAGPKAQALLQKLVDVDVSTEGIPLHGFPRDGGRRRALHGQPHHLYRRSRLRDLDGAGLSAAGLQGDQGRRRRVRHRRFRHARAAVDAAREELPDLVPRAEADLRRRSRARWTASSSWRRTTSSAARRRRRRRRTGAQAAPRLADRRCARCRRDGRRADLGESRTARITARSRSRTATARRASTPKARKRAARPRRPAPRQCAASPTANGAWSAGSPRAAMRTTSRNRWRRAMCRLHSPKTRARACSRSRSSATAALPASTSRRPSILMAGRCGVVGSRNGLSSLDTGLSRGANAQSPLRPPSQDHAVRAGRAKRGLARGVARKGRRAEPACAGLWRRRRSANGRRPASPRPTCRRCENTGWSASAPS